MDLSVAGQLIRMLFPDPLRSSLNKSELMASKKKGCYEEKDGEDMQMFTCRATERLTKMLDHIEKRVELLRQQAMAMERERDNLLEMIQAIETNKELASITQDEREEIQITAERLMTRILTVEVSVSTPRNENQERALQTVHKFIDDLLVKLEADPEGTKRALQTCLNTCSAEAVGPIDQRFQLAVIECAADDQKKTRQRLEHLIGSIDKDNR